MSKAGAVKIAFTDAQDLGFGLEPAKGSRVNYAGQVTCRLASFVAGAVKAGLTAALILEVNFHKMQRTGSDVEGSGKNVSAGSSLRSRKRARTIQNARLGQSVRHFASRPLEDSPS